MEIPVLELGTTRQGRTLCDAWQITLGRVFSVIINITHRLTENIDFRQTSVSTAFDGKHP
jgi:hypothetical protein